MLLFGGQATTGDTSALTLAEPFDNSSQSISLSLAIGFSNQAGGQFSLVDVNGQRMTSSAADFDDGAPANGALYTVGGIGDDPFTNPPDPNNTGFDDDEFYFLNPFLTAGETNISVFSQNPSNDDIIHLATFIIRGTAAIIGEGILLTPLNDTNPINTDHTVTALVQDDAGDPITGRDVDFEVISGPNVGLTGTDVTDADGLATFTWSSAVAGTDVVVASFVDSQGATVVSNEATKVWTDDGGGMDDTEAPVCAPVSFEFDGTNYAIRSSATDNVGIASATITRLTSNLAAYVEGNGPFAQGNSVGFTPAVAQANFEARVTTFSGAFAFLVTVTDAAGNAAVCDPVITDLVGAIPEVTSLGTSYPNPVSAGATVTVPFTLAEASSVRVVVYDVLGREVAVLADEEKAAGSYEVAWPEAASLPAGTYVVRLTAGAFTQTQRLTLVR